MGSISSWTVAAALTFAASAHCMGMCGGLVLAAAAAEGRAGARWRVAGGQALLNAGKAVSYMVLGALAGAFGGALVRHPLFGWSERVLALVAGAALGAAGLTLLGLRARGAGGASGRPGFGASLWRRLVGPLLARRPRGFSFAVGMAMGLLPCPLVYAGLAGAAASGSAPAGAAIMAGVALGTLPALVLVAASGTLVPAPLRQRLARVAGVLLLAVAAVTFARGLRPGGEHAGCVVPGMDHSKVQHEGGGTGEGKDSCCSQGAPAALAAPSAPDTRGAAKSP
jgi:sulfite exporter TauE/SafE